MWVIFAVVAVLFFGFVLWRRSVNKKDTNGGPDNHNPPDWTEEVDKVE